MSDGGDDALRKLFASIRLEISETTRAALLCFHCGKLGAVEHTDDVVGQMLLGQPPNCATCGSPIDVWKLLSFAMQVGDAAIGFGIPIGLHHTIVLYRLPIGGVKELDLRREGIPGYAQLLRVVHRPSKFHSALVLDVDALDSARRPSFEYRLIGVWNAQTPPEADVQGDTAVLWAPRDADDIGRQNLVSALDAFSNGRFRDAIVPANVAVEHTLSRVVDAYFEWIGIGRKRRDHFLRDAATFSHQLNILAPAIAHHLSAPRLPQHVLALLNRLRDLRNDTAHGNTATEFTREDLADCMAAAVVGFRYARILREHLAAARGTSC